MEQFKIDYIFNLYKDQSFSCTKSFRKFLEIKYNITDISLVSNIYQKINAYQVKKYGQNLTDSSLIFKELKGR